MAGRREVMQELAKLERSVNSAYVEAIKSKKVAVGELEVAISNGDTEQVQMMLELHESDTQEVIEILRNALIVGGTMAALRSYRGTKLSSAKTSLRGYRGVNQNGTIAALRSYRGINPNGAAAVQWLQEKSSSFITAITEQQRDAVREVLAASAQLGKNPRSTALDLVGRIGPSGKREGGIIGLNQPQATAVMNARLNLSSGDPKLMSKYLNNTRRDRRFDSAVLRAIESGTPLDDAQIDRIVSRYQDRLLITRGETIARTETIEALNYGREQSVREQAEETGARIVKTWEAGPDDGRQRETHTEANGQERDMDEPFTVGGYLLMYPGDASLGAPAEEVINCRCSVTYKVVSDDYEVAS